jgi:photosystem II stability/assembly factor-like uncharacterized protein
MLRSSIRSRLAHAVAAWLLLALPSTVGAQTPPAEARNFARHQEMAKSSPFAAIPWQFLGPENVSGRVTDVAVATRPGRTRTIYVATASGGVWMTENEGTSWTPIFEQAASTAIGDIAVAPSNPDIVWVGTGEANIFRTSPAGAGIYKSTDAGRTWQFMGLPATERIARIVIHPTNPDVVYVASPGHEWTPNEERGVFKTSDGGRSWEKVLYVDPMTGAIDLVMDPSDSSVLYAATWQRIRKRWNDPRNEPGYQGSGIHKTTDGGKTWVPINSGLPAAQFRGRIGLDIARSNPDVVYAFIDNYEIARQAKEGETDSYGRPRAGVIKGATVYRSDDKGGTWHQASEPGPFMEHVSATYGWVFGQIRVDPNDENRVYIMGLGLNVSSDGGRTFARVALPGGDLHALWIDPDNSSNLLNGNDQGFVVSYDQGRTWRRFADQIHVAQFFNVAFDMDRPFRVYGSVQDHGSRRGVVDLSKGRDKVSAVDFENAPGGEGSNHAIDPTKPNLVYSAGFYGSLSRSDYGALDARDRPKSASIMPKSDGEESLRGQWLAPFMLSPHDPDTLYLGLQYLFRSTTRGETWDRISRNLTDNDPAKLGDIPYQTIFALDESPKRAGLVYVGTDDGRVHRTDDGGRTWTELTANLPRRQWVSRVIASRHAEGTVYLTQTGRQEDDYGVYIWKSTDFGTTWTSLANGIPSGPVNVIREDPENPNILYVGTDIGVYVSTDAGHSWQVLGGGLPSTFVFDLVVHPRDQVLIAATHGRGMWVLDAAAVRQLATKRP